MRLLAMTMILILNVSALKAQSSDGFTLKINFKITKFDEGQILFALYDSEANHMEVTLKTAEAKVENEKAEVIIKNLKSGYYSFSYFHDVDSNGELDSNFMGIPKEPYGFSNGEKGRLGPPSFEDCKIKIENDLNIEISIK
jgi:uncharacterized protein (DUF2141 family)